MEDHFNFKLPPPPKVNFPYIAEESSESFKRKKSPSISATKSSKSSAMQRMKSNQKERKRNVEIKDAFHRLQRTIPYVPHDFKLPKVKTLRLAMNYIQYLSDIINEQDQSNSNSPPPCKLQTTTVRLNDFSQIVDNELQAKNTYKERAEAILTVSKLNKFSGLTKITEKSFHQIYATQ